jgi:ubiquinone/menaquinone biosynthesis C-methylase UbiE
MVLARMLVGQLARPSRPACRLMNVANARINAQAIQLLDPAAGDRVLEVGFGGGTALGKLIGRAAFVAGIDPSPSSVRAARRRFRRQLEVGRMRVDQAVAESIPYESASFDRVVTVNTIYFWPDPAQGLREMLRILAPGGRLLMATETRRVPRWIIRHGFTPCSEDAQATLLQRVGYCDIGFERRGRFLFAFAAKQVPRPIN